LDTFVSIHFRQFSVDLHVLLWILIVLIVARLLDENCALI